MKVTVRNSYVCPNCQTDWQDAWDCACEDDCPHCGTRHISPIESEDLTDDESEAT